MQINMLQLAGGLGLMVLSACHTTPLRDVYALRNVDPTTTDASALRVAVAVPEVVQLRAGAVQMKGVLTPNGGTPQVHEFDLVSMPNDPTLAQVATSQPGGMALHSYRIDPADLSAFEVFRAAAKATRVGDAEGSLTVNPGPCFVEDAPPGPLPMTIYLKTAELDRFVTLSKLDNLRDDVSDDELRELAAPCD